jgi:xylan 1,4-beta-xylosidase
VPHACDTAFSDIFEEGWLAGPPFQDTWGCITKEGIRKPVWRAFQLLHQSGDQLHSVSVTPDGAATTAVTAFATAGSGSNAGSSATNGPLEGLQVFVSNFWPSGGASAAPRTPVNTQITLQLGALAAASGSSRCFLWRIDDTSANPQAAWAAMGSPSDPTKLQLEVCHLLEQPASVK